MEIKPTTWTYSPGGRLFKDYNTRGELHLSASSVTQYFIFLYEHFNIIFYNSQYHYEQFHILLWGQAAWQKIPWYFTSGIEDFLGQRSSIFEEKLSEARKVALNKIKEEAYIRNGNAVIGVDMEYTSFDSNRVALIATGTVVKIESVDI